MSADPTAPSGWADVLLERTVAALAPAADSDRAAPMAAYLRGQFPFLGIPTPQRRALTRDAWSDLPAPCEHDLTAAALALWGLPEREYQHAACDLLARHRRVLTPQVLEPAARHLVTTASWWDTVDALSTAVVQPLVARHPALTATMRRWAGDDDRWLVRSAIIHQLGRRATTDAGLLFSLCAQHAPAKEFFVAKAIGWALRDYARTDPVAVAGFVAAHPELSALARREALKHLTA